MLLILGIHLREIPHVRQEDRHLDHFGQRGAGRLQDRGQVGDAEGRLGPDAAAAGGQGPVGQGGQLAGYVDGVRGADGLGLLLW